MLPGYHNFFRQIAGKVFRKDPVIPATNLTVEEKGEQMALLPLSYKFHNSGRVKAPRVEGLSYSDRQTDRTVGTIKVTDFPKNGYIGEGLYYE